MPRPSIAGARAGRRGGSTPSASRAPSRHRTWPSTASSACRSAASRCAYAEAIGLQLCFNEDCHLAGSLRSLASAEIEDASHHFALLASGQADAVLIPDADPQSSRLFLSAHAAFLASFWGALGGDLAAYRRRVASVLLGLAGRTGAVAKEPGAGHAPLERWEPSASRAHCRRRSAGSSACSSARSARPWPVPSGASPW